MQTHLDQWNERLCDCASDIGDYESEMRSIMMAAKTVGVWINQGNPFDEDELPFD